MIDNYILAGIERQASLDAAKAEFFAKGKKIVILDPCGDEFPPERQDKIDPETVLKRRKPSISLSERRALRRATEAL